MDALARRLDALEAENQKLKEELAQLKSVCSVCDDLVEIKEDLERLKKSSPDSFGASPGLYSRVKGIKKNRPQSLHEVTITQALQDQLASPKPTTDPSLGPLPPFYFTLENFSHHKKHCLRWFSTPFYTHPRGYKMCVSVYAAGTSVGEGTHVSVLIHFLRGEFDDTLQWPFRGTVRVSLLNERKDGGHWSSKIEFDEEATYVDSGRVGGSFERSCGYGKPMFIEHALLGYDQSKDCEYLKYDRLRFIVESVDKTR